MPPYVDTGGHDDKAPAGIPGTIRAGVCGRDDCRDEVRDWLAAAYDLYFDRDELDARLHPVG
jgi:hypothetical protein